MNDPFSIKEAIPGFRVCSYPTDRFKTGRLSVSLIVPLGKDAAANALIPYVLTRSCKEYPDYISLSKKLAELYGASLAPTVGKAGENQLLTIGMTMIDSRFSFDGADIIRDCAELLKKVIFEPNLEDGCFPKQDIEHEKRLMAERIESIKNDKRAYAMQRAIEEMCADEAYGIRSCGKAEEVKALTPEDVYNAYTHVLKTARVQLDVIGSADVGAIEKIFADALAAAGRDSVITAETELRTEAAEVRRVTEEQPVKQGKLVLGYRTGMTDPYKDYPALRVMTDIFGGSPNSRCFMNVREKQSLCYYCSARFRSQKGLIFVQSGIETENAEKVIAEVQKQLDGMCAGDVTQEDMDKSLKGLADGFGTVTDSPEDIDSWFMVQICDEIFETPSELIGRLKAVTREDVIAAAKTVKLDTVFLLSGNGEEEDDD